jgi:hypothetical protein
MLHFELPIYRTVADLQRVIFRGVAHVRRDFKPTLGKLLLEESLFISVQIRRANVAIGALKVPEIDGVLEQLEIVQLALRHGRELQILPNAVYEDAAPLLVEAGKQATKWRQRFAPAPTPVA